MKRKCAALSLIWAACLLVVASAAAQDRAAASSVRFAALDVYVDSSAPLAAWQFELSERRGRMTVVGVENGDSAAFANAPRYDLAAVQRGDAERIIVADFSLDPAARLPVGATRVATIHVRLRGAEEPDYELRLIAAGDAAGQRIDASIRLSPEEGR